MSRRARIPAAFLLAACALALACSGGGGGGSQPPPAACDAVSALQVTSTTPEQNQTGVSVRTAITMRFNTCLDLASVTSTSVALHRNGTTAVAGATSWDAAQSALVFVPAADLEYGVQYLFAVIGVKGAHGETLAAPQGIAFRTRSAPETIPPTTAAAPAGDYYDAPPSVTLACTDNAGGTGCAATYFTIDGSTPTTASARYLVPVVVDRSLTLRFFSVDGDGNAEAPRSETYVIDTDPPGVASVEPVAGATGVRLDARVRIVFDEPMRAPGFPALAPVAPGSTTVEPGSLAVVRQPSEPYECATTYEVTVPASASDLAGNILGTPYTFSFTTSPDCGEPNTTASVASGAHAAPQSVTLSCDDGAGGSGCARIVYTLDGSVPTFSPQNGVVVAGATAGPIGIGEGETVLRFRAEDAVGHVEAARERRYSVSTQGFSWLATDWGLARGVGKAPETFVTRRSYGKTWQLWRDASTGRLYRAAEGALLFSDDGVSFHDLPVRRPGSTSSVSPSSVAAQGSRIYVGTWNGLLVSTDGGATFVERSFGSYDANRIVRLAVSGNDVFVATATSLHVSHDRSRTWRSTFGAVDDLAVDGDTVYVAGDGRVAVSRDRGESWTTPALPGGAGTAYAVAFQGDSVYVGTDAGVAISSDRGATFGSLAQLDGNPVTRVGAGDGYAYAASKVLFSSAPSAFWVSASGGAFTRRRIPGGTRDVDVHDIHVEGPDVHLGAYPSYWVSHDHGATFALADLPGSAARRVIAAGAKVYAAIEDSSGFGGLVISSDRGTTFTYRGIESGLPDDSVDDLFVDGTKLYAGTWRGLAITTNDGATFDVRTEANSGLWQSTASAIWASGSTVWASAVTTLQRSTNGGTTFVARMSSSDPGEIAVSGPNVYVGTRDGVMVSNDGGAAAPTFSLRTPTHGLAEAYVRDLDVAPDGKLFVGTTSALDVSSDAGATFQRVTLPPSISPYAVSACGGVLYVGTSPVAISDDGGATFAVRGASQGVPGGVEDACYSGP
jgi:ligand-binding sensor domain-containing protein